MNEKKKRCTITGLNPHQLPFSEDSSQGKALKIELKKAILQAIEDGYLEFFCGMELGCELWAGEILLELRQAFPIKINSVIASEHRADHWSDEDRERYFDQVLPQADVEIYTARADSPEAIFQRNEYLAQNTERLIAVTNGAEISDTADLIRRMTGRKKEVVLVEI